MKPVLRSRTEERGNLIIQESSRKMLVVSVLSDIIVALGANLVGHRE